jgi:hypothetical protein
MVTGIEIAQQAKEQLVGVTGLTLDTVSAIIKDDQGWHVTLEIVEMRRIPEGNDMLATYETLLNDEGELISYQRTRRYRRDQLIERES